jgi:hypothetical protein
MRRFISICGVAAFAVAILLVTIPKSYTSTAQSRGAQIVGSWYCLFDFSPYAGPGTANPGLGTFYRDGNASYTPGFMFGLFPDTPEATSPSHGTWVNTGPRTFASTTMALRFDRVTGVLVGIARARTSFQFGDDFDQVQGTLLYEKVDCVAPIVCPDPMDPATVWTPDNPPGGWQFTGKRIRPLPAGPLP